MNEWLACCIGRNRRALVLACSPGTLLFTCPVILRSEQSTFKLKKTKCGVFFLEGYLCIVKGTNLNCTGQWIFVYGYTYSLPRSRCEKCPASQKAPYIPPSWYPPKAVILLTVVLLIFQFYINGSIQYIFFCECLLFWMLIVSVSCSHGLM